jgi:hypothetical protein
MMNKEIKTKWLAALRSGEYKQGMGALHNIAEDSYCCLGVLCDIYAKEHQESENVRRPHPDSGETEMFYDESAVAPDLIVSWAGIQDGNPYIKVDNKYNRSVRQLNDNGKTFEEIADIIEEQL